MTVKKFFGNQGTQGYPLSVSTTSTSWQQDQILTLLKHYLSTYSLSYDIPEEGH